MTASRPGSTVEDALDRLDEYAPDLRKDIATVRGEMERLTEQNESLVRRLTASRVEVGRLTEELANARVLIDVEWPAQVESAEAAVERLTEERDGAVEQARAVQRIANETFARAESAEAENARLTAILAARQFSTTESGATRMHELEAENARLSSLLESTREGLRDAAEAEEHLAARGRSDVDYEGAAIHSHAASVVRALLAASPAPGDTASASPSDGGGAK